jgi:hypothetical protein
LDSTPSCFCVSRSSHLIITGVRLSHALILSMPCIIA